MGRLMSASVACCVAIAAMSMAGCTRPPKNAVTPPRPTASSGRPAKNPLPTSLPIRTFEVDGSPAPTEWIAVTAGSLVATGYLNRADSRPSDRQLLDVVVDQSFRGVHVFHVIPAFGDSRSRVVEAGVEGRLPPNAIDSELLLKRLSVTMSRHDGWLFIDDLRLTGEEVDWSIETGYVEYPPQAEADWALEETGTPLTPWMSVSTRGTTLISGRIQGVGYTTKDDSDEFDEGSVDVYVPDEMAGLRYVHVVRVIVPSKRLYSRVEEVMDAEKNALFGLRLERGRFVLDAIQ